MSVTDETLLTEQLEQAEARIQAVRELHRQVEYRPGDHYANYNPPEARRLRKSLGIERPDVITVCEECQRVLDEADTEGGYADYSLAEYPCPTIRALEGDT